MLEVEQEKRMASEQKQETKSAIEIYWKHGHVEVTLGSTTWTPTLNSDLEG